MDKNTIRKGVKIVVGFSVGHVVKTLIENNLDPETRLQKAEVAVGSFVLGGIVADHAVSYVDEFITTLTEKKNPEDNPRIP